ncbi:unnamed protein product, partial [Ectocarpus sp. 12 AP-2014]
MAVIDGVLNLGEGGGRATYSERPAGICGGTSGSFNRTIGMYVAFSCRETTGPTNNTSLSLILHPQATNATDTQEEPKCGTPRAQHLCQGVYWCVLREQPEQGSWGNGYRLYTCARGRLQPPLEH